MVCPILLAVGLAILLVSEFTGIAALRIVAVVVLLSGAIGGGIRAGLATEPPALFKAFWMLAWLSPAMGAGTVTTFVRAPAPVAPL